MMFRCQEINNKDLTGPCISYELLGRRVCRNPNNTSQSYAVVYANDPKGCNQLGYVKQPYRAAVHDAGLVQSIVFQDVSKGISVNLAATLNGKKSTITPLEKIIKA